MAKARPKAGPAPADNPEKGTPFEDIVDGESINGKETPRKRAFARHYVESGQAQVAYLKAGYTSDPSKKAYALLKDPWIYAEIERLYREIELDTLVTTRYVIGNIRRAADITGQVRFNPVLGTLDMLDVSSHLNANRMLGQFLGIFREKVDVGENLAAVLSKLADPAPGT